MGGYDRSGTMPCGNALALSGWGVLLVASDGTAILAVGFRRGGSGYVVLSILHGIHTYGYVRRYKRPLGVAGVPFGILDVVSWNSVSTEDGSVVIPISANLLCSCGRESGWKLCSLSTIPSIALD